MLKIVRTNSDDPDFIRLVELLDADLSQRDGNEHSFYAQFNKIDMIKHVVVAYEDGTAVACGTVKQFSSGTMEIKRMYTLPEQRGKGIASRVLTELEAWAAELKCSKCILETGKRQPEAIKFYQSNGYTRIPNYGQYTNIDNSVCFEKGILN
jgi:putative acetyltransferase